MKLVALALELVVPADFAGLEMYNMDNISKMKVDFAIFLEIAKQNWVFLF